VLPPEFNIVVGLTGDDAVAVSVTGELDSAGVGRLRAVLYGILRAGHHRVVIDLVRIGFVDSGAQEMLARVLKRARAQGGDMTVFWGLGAASRA
jgi:anti-sigma B factor antagonist